MVVFTGFVLTGELSSGAAVATAEFDNCGQGLREGGDVKLRGVLVGRIGGIERIGDGICRVSLELNGDDIEQIPANVNAQIRAKTIFGEKWVELLYPTEPVGDRLADGDNLGLDRTIDPLEVETILNTALPLLDAIDPENLSAALNALAEGFVGQEQAAITGLENGNLALEPLNDNEDLLEEGIDLLAEGGQALDDLDEDLVAAITRLNEVQNFTVANSGLLAETLQKTPRALDEFATLFEVRFFDFTKIVNQGATVIGVVAAHADDLDRLLTILPQFNSAWIRNINQDCHYRQVTTEPGKSVGDVVPGRCWQVHNLVSHSRGAYAPGTEPQPNGDDSELEASGVSNPNDLDRLLFAPVAGDGGGDRS